MVKPHGGILYNYKKGMNLVSEQIRSDFLDILNEQRKTLNLPPVGARLQRQDGGIITSLEQLHEKINEMRNVFNSLENKVDTHF